MARQKVIIALFGLVMGAAGMLFWLSPRLQKDQLAAALPSATRPLTIPFSRLLTTADPTPWVDISPTVRATGKPLVPTSIFSLPFPSFMVKPIP